MGTDVLVVVVGDDGPELAARARSRIQDLEQRWSRFLPDSEISAVNASAGSVVPVSTVTAEVLSAASEGWRLTGGRFDPTMLRSLERAGYDRSFELLEPADRRCGRLPSSSSPSRTSRPSAIGAATLGLRVDESAGTVLLEEGLGLDLGGIGKGRAADLTVVDLLHAGAEGACVDVGGDVRVAGRAPHEGGWVVGVADPSSDNDVATTAVALADGAVATSSRCRRRWLADGRAMHHLIDPTTGRPAEGDLDTVTVIAAEAWWAEVIAKAALIAGSIDGAELIAALGLCGLLRRTDRTVVRVGDLASFEAVEPRAAEPVPVGASGRSARP